MSSELPDHSFGLKWEEAVSVYLLLKEREQGLDQIRLQLLARLERELYARLTIAEMENIENLYRELI